MRTLTGNLKPKGNENVDVKNTIEYFLEKWLDGTIKPRPFNRGNIGVNKAKVRAIADNFRPGSLGTIGVAENDDGTYELYDFETRIRAIELRHSEGNLTQSDRKYELTASVCNEKEKDNRYADCNSNIAHSGVMKATDRSRAMGYHGHIFTETADIDLLPGLHVTMWDNIYAAKDFSDKPVLKALRLARKKIANKEDGIQDKALEARAIVLTSSVREGVKKGLSFYKEFQSHVDRTANEFKSGTAKKMVKSLKNQAGLFTVILADALSEKPILTELDPEEVANKAILNVTEVVKGSKIIAKRHTTTVGDVEALFKFLGIKGPKLNEITKKFCGANNKN